MHVSSRPPNTHKDRSTNHARHPRNRSLPCQVSPLPLVTTYRSSASRTSPAVEALQGPFIEIGLCVQVCPANHGRYDQKMGIYPHEPFSRTFAGWRLWFFASRRPGHKRKRTGPITQGSVDRNHYQRIFFAPLSSALSPLSSSVLSRLSSSLSLLSPSLSCPSCPLRSLLLRLPVLPSP